ncbi:serum response factor-binding protein 1-like isoform X2 [Limulus polyphemus]|uniref:Serum response factor-binding protein 1-like isoform X2 n=1 Tax=Limulus polyphemus TaxID=6850 RepID=A0ABM1T965_LIMPO|nr:serum response factor-binding protein 1-like isoform X2 [Limulus polyphemus]
MEKVKVNIQIVKMRKSVREAKVLLVRKHIRQVKQLKNKRGSKEELEKNQRKIGRLCDEINMIKRKPIDDISRQALARDESWDEIWKQKEGSLEKRVEARLAGHPKVQKCVQHFRSKNSQWESWVPSVLQVWESQHVTQLTGGNKSKIGRRKEDLKDETQQNHLKQEEENEEKLLADSSQPSSEYVKSQVRNVSSGSLGCTYSDSEDIDESDNNSLPDCSQPSSEDVKSQVMNVSSGSLGCTYSDSEDIDESDSNSGTKLSLQKKNREENKQQKHPKLRLQYKEGNSQSKHTESTKNKSNVNNAKHKKKTDSTDSGECVDKAKTENVEVAECNIEHLLNTKRKLKTVISLDETKNEDENVERESNPKIRRKLIKAKDLRKARSKSRSKKKKTERVGLKPYEVKRSCVKILPKCEGSLTIAPVNLDELQDHEEIVFKKSKEAEDINTEREKTHDDHEGTHHDAFFLGGVEEMEEVTSDNETRNYEHPMNQNFKSNFISSLSGDKERNRMFEKQRGFRRGRGFGSLRGTSQAVPARSTLQHRGRFVERESSRRDASKQHLVKSNLPSKVFSPWEKSSISYGNNREKATSKVPTNQVLHPSWEAKMKLKDKQNQLVAFQGKKIKFDDE